MKNLNDLELESGLERSVAREREAIGEVLSYLRELERRKPGRVEAGQDRGDDGIHGRKLLAL